MNCKTLDILINKLPKEVDLTLDTHSKQVFEAVDTLLNENITLDKINSIEESLLKRKDTSLIFILLVLKIAKSKLLVKRINKPLFISVVFAVYKEHNRIKKNTEHPHGEDFLNKKITQIEWLFKDNVNVKWELVVVDDGCPDNSGIIAEEIIENNNLQDKARVLFLANAIEKNEPPVQSITTTKESQKGGSILYGMWDAVKNKGKENHIVVYTDADLSTHLGQLMLLITPLLNNKKSVAIGSRREPSSVVVKKGKRNDRGKMFIYLWKRLIPNLGNIIDTQCGFKAFRADLLPYINHGLIENKFAFDIELLLKSAIHKKENITKIPIAWIDSEAASTTTDLQPYLPMLQSIAKMSVKYFPENSRNNEFVPFIENLNEKDFKYLLNHIPQAIVDREPDEFTEYDKVTVKDFMLAQ